MNHFPFIKQPDAMDCGPVCIFDEILKNKCIILF